MKTVRIPNTIHFIWFGGALPHHYRENLYHWNRLAKASGYNVILWMNLPELYYPDASPARIKMQHHLLHLKQRGIQTFHYQDLFHASVSTSNPLFRPTFSPTIKHYYHTTENFLNENAPLALACQQALRNEFSSPQPNLAVASDIFRMMLLYFMGGIYMDVGDILCKTQADPLPRLMEFRVPDEYHFSMRFLTQPDGSVTFSNDLLMAPPNNAGCLAYLSHFLKTNGSGYSWEKFKNASSSTDIDVLQSLNDKKKYFFRNIHPSLIEANRTREMIAETFFSEVYNEAKTPDCTRAIQAHINFILFEYSGPVVTFNALQAGWSHWPLEERPLPIPVDEKMALLQNTCFDSAYLLRNQLPIEPMAQANSWLPTGAGCIPLFAEEDALEVLTKKFLPHLRRNNSPTP